MTKDRMNELRFDLYLVRRLIKNTDCIRYAEFIFLYTKSLVL